MHTYAYTLIVDGRKTSLRLVWPGILIDADRAVRDRETQIETGAAVRLCGECHLDRRLK